MTTLLELEPMSPAAVVAADHEQIDAALTAVTEALDGPVRDLLLAHDAVLAVLSRHLVAMEVAVCPIAAARLADGRRTIRGHMTGARRLETAMHDVGQVLWGDALAPNVPLDVLQQRVLDRMAEHRAEEERMLDRVDAVLSPDERAAVAARLQHATVHGPTRPHPHAVRRTTWTRALYRPVAVLDRVLDAVNSRTVPPPLYVRRRSRRVGLWGSYLLGTQVPPQREEDVSRRSS